jgi:hypothetical protein
LEIKVVPFVLAVSNRKEDCARATAKFFKRLQGKGSSSQLQDCTVAVLQQCDHLFQAIGRNTIRIVGHDREFVAESVNGGRKVRRGSLG